MKKRNTRFPSSAWVALAMCALSMPVKADRPSKVAVATNQIKSLGIQTEPLQAQSDSMKVRYPAQVIVPPFAENLISSPVAGRVSSLLVYPNQVIKTGPSMIAG
jgi:cobalt-zinc-cadmium efflux system membrane fusion protein